ncbi:helix-turn-helix domain-containing protein [Streptomyces sp. TBY4]|uniref:helix-turn-helix transcriptional regulator n=1 Tax=Streptomyces sp. TBY4 TaxID=2962030 RepID=UPI0020B7B3D6|nr:helix-turn-helix domain-containing protein [Streptomyces sp. TBY4]MCP3759249.1 MarR family winged helix-turn-helix transcriptional regulator [Streptomyces sp. TBY4]
MGEPLRRAPWTFLTSHARVLMALERDPGVRLRDVATTCLLTERTVQALVADLEEGGYLTRVRDGRRNRYRITPGAKFRHPAEAEHDIAELLHLFAQPGRPGQPGPARGLQVETPALDTGRDARRLGL